MEKDLSASAELSQLYMYLFASEVRWGTSELTLFQKAITKKKKKKKKQSGQEICHQTLTLLLDQDTIYIMKYFCMRYFMNTGNGQRINVINKCKLN